MPESFHIHCYGPSDSSAATSTSGIGSQPCFTHHPAIPTSFEAALARLEQSLPQVLFEPDGSLAWASPDHQIVGMVYDAQMTIQYVELRGHCDRPKFYQLMQTLAGMEQIGSFRVMVLPERQWKDLQTFAKTLPAGLAADHDKPLN